MVLLISVDSSAPKRCTSEGGPAMEIFFGVFCEILTTVCCADIKIQNAEDLLITSVRMGDVEKVKTLLLNGVSPDAATKFGTSVLWSACFRGSVEMTKALIEAGADVNLGNQKGTTPLFIASQMGHAEIVQSLLDAGAL